MIEKQEAEDFDEAEDESLEAEGPDEEVDIARLTRDLDIARKRGGNRSGIPAWRKLELLAEQRRTAELTSDFDDYDLDEPKRPPASRPRMSFR